jgi:hypothetical protein
VSKAPLARFAVAPQPLDYDPDLLLGQETAVRQTSANILCPATA